MLKLEVVVQYLVVKKTLITLLLLLLMLQSAFGDDGVQLHIENKYVVMDNGLVQVKLSTPEGQVTGISYNGIDNLLERQNPEAQRGYWDLNWNEPGSPGKFMTIQGTKFRVIMQNEDQVEVSFTITWDASQRGSFVPLNIDKRFIMLRGSHGFYTYSIYEHLKGWPDFNLLQTRIAFKLRKDMFQEMAVDQTRQGRMPFPDDRMSGRGEPLAYPEAVRFTNPIEQEFRGKVDDKYQFSSNSEDIKVHGWMSTNPSVGFWQITPSHEYRSGGPFKQQLTSHVGPTSLTVFISGHYMGEGRTPEFRNGEAWKKVFGPVFIYLNSGSTRTKSIALWNDANTQMKKEMRSWPYSFPVSDDFPKSKQRGSISGRLLVRDRYINVLYLLPAGSAHIGLAVPGEVGSWQTECKGYQFWTLSSTNGVFTINNVRPGTYNLYASVPGFIGEYKSDRIITIRPGKNTDLGDVIYYPPRNGPTLWEIGYPDRSAAEFFIPDPDPHYVNPLLTYHDRFRQYGLWDKFSSIYPNEDLVYTIHRSDYRKDWFFAHATRKTKDNSYEANTWQIKFYLSNVKPSTTYKLRLALAAASQAELLVRFNSLNIHHPHFRTGKIGGDNAIARHGIHGIYWLFNIDARSEWLVKGENTIYLTQATRGSPFAGLMYDYIRFEGPSNGCSGYRSFRYLSIVILFSMFFF